jgi:hypothetical protein
MVRQIIEEIMNLNISFFGDKEPYKYPNPLLAMRELNEWRAMNADVRIINIENRGEYSAQVLSAGQAVESTFVSISVWFEDSRSFSEHQAEGEGFTGYLYGPR